MTYNRYASDDAGNIVQSSYNSDGNWVGQGPDPRIPVKWREIVHTPVTAELVALAAKHTGMKIEYREPESDHARNGQYHGSLWTNLKGYLGVFTDELERLQKLVTKPLDEPILDDDHRVHQGYLYVADGKVREFIDGMNMTVGRWKALRIRNVDPVNEVRRCDLDGRVARLPLKVTKTASSSIEAARHGGQRKRRPRSSNKIKKVA